MTKLYLALLEIIMINYNSEHLITCICNLEKDSNYTKGHSHSPWAQKTALQN